MKIAFFHYHLKPGGVTSVIKQQVAALKDTCETLVAASVDPGASENIKTLGTEVMDVPLAAYDKDINVDFSGEDLARSILKAIKQKWPQGCDVLHVHNPTLAKNRELLDALEILRDEGINLFLQIHDFAEDGRPAAYYDRDYVSDVHYGVINSRDYDILVRAGLKPEGLHMIENQVTPFEFNIDEPGEDGLVLYPVRALRRKNIGETLLISLFLEKKQTIGITLPPNSPGDLEIYRQWKTFIANHGFDVKPEVGLKRDFRELVREVCFFITTSVNEGFGFAFLEPWTAGKMVFGRNLAHVCRDFQGQGVDLSHLYDALYIPLDCIDKRVFYDKWEDALLRLAAAFDYPLAPGELRRAFERITTDNTIDFGILDETAQMQALLEIKNSGGRRDAVRRLNPLLDRVNYRSFSGSRDVILHNNDIIRDHYGKEGYRKRLLRIYRQVMSGPVTQRIDKAVLLKEFFDPARFSILKGKPM